MFTLWKVKWSRYRPGVAQRVGRGVALLFHDRGTRRGWVVSSTPRLHFTPGKDLVPILREAGWAPGPVWMGRKSPPHRDSIPDHPAHSCYTDWATRPTMSALYSYIMLTDKALGVLKHCYHQLCMWIFWKRDQLCTSTACSAVHFQVPHHESRSYSPDNTVLEAVLFTVKMFKSWEQMSLWECLCSSVSCLGICLL